MNEFDFIAAYLAPLAAGDKGALGLKDDAALVRVPQGHELVITKDALVEGVHFTGHEPPDVIARKMLRVNLSDLAAMGAKPYGYFMALMLPGYADEAWLAAFAEGLKGDQEIYGLHLLGGDTTRTPGPLALSVTALGIVPIDTALKRSGAKAGDDIYVTGTIGDAALGLREARGSRDDVRGSENKVIPRPSSLDSRAYLLQRYQLPEPRIAFGQALRGIASSCMDISDGLAQDLGHICECSEVGAIIHWPRMPLSDAARKMQPEDFHEAVLAGGDDYELLFTAPASESARIQSLAEAHALAATRIGQIKAGKEVLILDAEENPIMLARKGYRHFE